MKPATVLLVEDNPITMKLVRFTLENHGFCVVGAADGEAALRSFDQDRVGLVLQDLVLPDMDGFELVRRLRDLPGGSEVPILAFSGLLSKIEEARVSAVGFDDVISKPIEPSRLLQIVRAHLPSDETVFDRFGEGRRVVVADDDAVQRKLVCFRLQKLGFEVVGAADGLDALARSRESRPDVIVSDVLMPALDGFGLCVAVRRDPVLDRTPIILVTNSYVESDDRALARRAGANDLVLRTPELGEVLESLRANLRRPHVPPIQPPVPPVPPVIDAEIEAERVRRVMKQLERQVGLNAGVTQRCALLSAELSVLSGISEALAKQHDIHDALEQVLAACFDAGGFSLGALYVCEDEGFRVLRFGAPDGWTDDDVESFFGDPALLSSTIQAQTLVAIPSESVSEARGSRFLDRAGTSSALVAPLGYKGKVLGALLMMSTTSELNNEDRIVFAQAVANQISQALALTQAFTDKDESERAARDQAAVLRSILESIADGVIVADERGRFIHWNPAAEAIMRMHPTDATADGWISQGSFFLPDRVTQFPRDEFPLARAMRGESVDRVEVFMRHDSAPEGVWLSASARPLRDGSEVRGGALVFRDVTGERAAQAQLMVSDRMASVGMLAAGVAHEINNPLASVVANLDLAVRDLGDLERKLGGEVDATDLRDELKEARHAADRVRQIVRDLRIFSRAEDDKRGAVDVRRVLDSSVRMAWNEIRHRARLVTDYGEVPPVDANESRLGQVFLNLIMNAAQAIPEGNADQNEIRVSARQSREGWVRVDIADTGEGMPAHVVARLFTPFFTTKPAGIGTGLGLTICQRLITAIGGEISVESAVGKGTLFCVLLPALQRREVEVVGVSAGVVPARRRGRVLVIDDEVAMVSAVHRMLSAEHDVVVLTSAALAVDRIEAGERFDVILCDLMMPVMTGMDMYEKLAEIAPDQVDRVVFLTGGAFTPKARAFLDQVDNPRLEKPFDVQNLRAIVNDRVR